MPSRRLRRIEARLIDVTKGFSAQSSDTANLPGNARPGAGSLASSGSDAKPEKNGAVMSGAVDIPQENNQPPDRLPSHPIATGRLHFKRNCAGNRVSARSGVGHVS